MAITQTIHAKLTADAISFNKGMNEAITKTNALDKSLLAAKVSIGAIGLVGAAAAVGMLKLAKSSAEAVDQQYKLANVFGTTASSIATLQRAGDLTNVSIEEIGASSKILSIKLSEAAQGSEKAAELFSKLKVSAEELSKLPLDERIAKINHAINENIPAMERASITAELFGSRTGFALRQLDPAAIAEAREEAVLFGHALSDVDASKIDAANDSLSTISYAMEGLGKQLALELAPIMQGLVKLFKDTAKEGGGIGTSVRDGVDDAISAMGFLLDMADGVKRGFELVANSIIATLAMVDAAGASLAYNVMRYLDKIPGVDISESTESMRQEMELMKGVVEQSKIAFDEILNRPMPSEGLKKFVADARVAAEEAAKEAVKIKQSTESAAGITATGKVAKTAETKADPGIEARAKELDSIRESLLSQTEALRQKLENDRVLLDQAVIDKTVSLQEANAIEAQLVAEHQASLTEIQKVELDKRKALDDAANKAKFQAISQSIQALGMLMDTGSKKGFERSKKFALADAAISMYQGIAAGVKLGWPMAIPAVAYAAGVGASQIRNIKSQTFGGNSAGHIGTISGGGGSSGGGGGGGEGGGGKTTNMFVRGINPNDMFSGSQLVDIINKAQAEGAQLRLA